MGKLLAAVAVFCILPATSQTIDPCGAGKTPILILGSYHMDNPGLDSVNLQADDVLAPGRQREIAELNTKLARFAPTKIAIEGPRISTAWNDRYKRFLAGDYKPGRNEIEQIGFQLGKQAGVKQMTPIDFPMWMNGLTPAEMHTPKPKEQPKATATPSAAPSPAAEPDPRTQELMREVKKRDDLLKSSTVTEYLAYVNSPEQYNLNHRWDVIFNLRPGEDSNLYARTDLALNWYKRNLRIFTNLLDAAAPGDRVLVLFGYGHLHILKDLAKDHPDLCLVDALAYLK
jgi:hypothetical protein